VRIVKLGGEAVRKGDFESYRRLFDSHCRLSCGLASTEVGAVRQFFLTRDSDVTSGHVGCGYPVPDMDVLILDETGKPCPQGSAGEIAIRSRYIARGYWNNKELTQQTFITDLADDSVRTFRMGDLGRLTPDGALIHLGRKDRQVKISGNRVELGEIEVALLRHSSVSDAVASSWTDGLGHARLACFYTTISSAVPPDESAIREFLRDHLPGYMLPSRFVHLCEMPLLPNGKIDHGALPCPTSTTSSAEVHEDDMEENIPSRLLRIWRAVLDDPALDMRTDFELAGGDSLKRLDMVARVEAEFQTKLSTRAIVEGRTVERMARLLNEDEDALFILEDGDFTACLLPLRTEGTGTPLYLISPAGGTLAPYIPLVQQMAADRPIYGICVRTRRFLLRPGETMDRVCRTVVQLLQQHRPEGEWQLAGWSWGGMVAYEVARLLNQAGGDVLPPIVIDTSLSLNGRDVRTFLRSVRLCLQMIRRSAPFVRDARRLRHQLTQKGDERRPPLSPEVDGRFEFFPSLWSLVMSFPEYARMLRYFSFQDAGLPMVYLSACDNSDAAARSTGWQTKNSGEVYVVPVPGNHFTMMLKPSVRSLAGVLDALATRHVAEVSRAGTPGSSGTQRST
jgi:thioesterase domain-containing protein/acyl carrier protein